MAEPEFTPSRRTRSYAALVARFWAKVGPPDANRCRLWLGGKNSGVSGGYGYFKVCRLQVRAHELAWRLTYYGPTAPSAEVFRHSCDHPWCCEPAHIYPGTHAQNIAERDARGRTARGDRSGLRVHPERTPRGERNASARLTAGKVAAIRLALGQGVSQQIIADNFGVSQPTISRIKRRAKKGGWAWLDGSHH